MNKSGLQKPDAKAARTPEAGRRALKTQQNINTHTILVTKVNVRPVRLCKATHSANSLNPCHVQLTLINHTYRKDPGSICIQAG